jgi:UDP-glucose 4-epimerase
MKILITGSAGHLGEALLRTLSSSDHQCVGIDIKESPFTDEVGSISEPGFADHCMQGIDAVLHAATLHKPHVATHSRQDFVDTNITGTLNLLEAAVRTKVRAFVYTSTTSTFGDAMRPGTDGAAVWVTEDLQPLHKNIYGLTKTSAEGFCQIFSRNMNLPCIVLRTSRFFPEDDDNRDKRAAFSSDNLKVNELLFRRADIADMVSAHLLAIEKAPELGFDRFIISAPSPFRRRDVAELGVDAPAVLKRYVPEYVEVYLERGWKMFRSIGRVYDGSRAQELLGWRPGYTFRRAIERLAHGRSYQSDLARQVGVKGYHDIVFDDGPFPIEETVLMDPEHGR